MEQNINNRMTETRRQGRPSNAEILAREKPTVAEVVADPDAASKLPVIQPIKCPCCGRGMTPKVSKTNGDRRYISCTLCGRMMVMVYGADGKNIVTKL